jgi:hypothetical protein
MADLQYLARWMSWTISLSIPHEKPSLQTQPYLVNYVSTSQPKLLNLGKKH